MEWILSRDASRIGFNRRASLERRLLWITVALNVAWRLVRYLLDFPIWGDEAMLAVNFIDRNGWQLLEPLDYVQVAPVGFLWVEWLITRLLGVNGFALRLFPLISGVLAVFLLVRLMKLCLSRRETLLGMGLFCASYYPVRHGVEIKPYSIDLLMSIVQLLLAVRLRSRMGSWKLWSLFAICGSASLWLSYPAAFVAGGLTLSFAFAAWKSKISWVFPVWFLTGLLLTINLATTVMLFAEAQANSASEFVDSTMWNIAFPPVDKPWEIPGWLIRIHTGRMLAYPAGGKNYASTATFLLVIAGVLTLVRRSRSSRQTSIMLLSIPGLALIAAALKKYPYGGSVRTTLYLAPVICVFAAVGLRGLIAASNRPRKFRRGLLITVFLLMAVQIGGIVRDVLHPFKTEGDRKNRLLINRLIQQTDPQGDVWVLGNSVVGWPDRPGTLPGPGLTVAAFGFYARTGAPVPVVPGDLERVKRLDRHGLIRILIHDTRNNPLPVEPLNRLINSFRAEYGSSREEDWPIDKEEFLRVVTFRRD